MSKFISVGARKSRIHLRKSHDVLLFLLIAALFFPVRVFELVTHPLPYGFAGFYSEMADAIANNGYRLPDNVALYGPHGVPLAYPPLALYAMAFACHGLHISTFAYLRFAPLLFTGLSIVPLFGLFKELVGREAAMVAVVLLMATPDFLVYHEFADGTVRGLALLLMSACLYYLIRAWRLGDPRSLVASALLSGGTLLCHLSNEVFIVLSGLIFVVARGMQRRELVMLVVVVAGGIMVAAPWWLADVHSHGMTIFTNALHSRSSTATPGEQHWGQLYRLWQHYKPVGTLWLPEYLLALLGAGLCTARRQWMLPLWLVATVVVMPDNLRFVPIVVALLAAVIITRVPLADAARGLVRRPLPLVAWLTVAWTVSLYVIWALLVRPILTMDELQSATWIRAHTSNRSSVLVATISRARAEWFPYLSHRRSVISEWGTEWTGGVYRQHQLFDEQSACVSRQSVQCLERLLQKNILHPTYLVLPDQNSVPRLGLAISRSALWNRVYSNATETIWQRVDPTVASHATMNAGCLAPATRAGVCK